MISVCMATKNGAPYLREQMDSILRQLSAGDELIISDDHSSDHTVSLIQSYADPRIRLFQNTSTQGIPKNFEAALSASRGSLIFLADQDDVWKENKIQVMATYLRDNDLVICDCLITDHSLNTKTDSFFRLNNSRKGLIRNIFKNSYMGCCMAFNRNVLTRALPFPNGIPMHDYWIGLIGELTFTVRFIPEVLVFHRRHSANASTTGNSSNKKLSARFVNRYRIIKHLFLRKSYAA
jgi:glycosyltransferase involved in cell wall biosynthesis